MCCFARVVTSGDSADAFETHLKQISEVQKKLKGSHDLQTELDLLTQIQNLLCNLFTDLFGWSEQMSKNVVETNQNLL